MLKFQVATAEDRKLAAAIERRRQIEEARRPRIFNTRARKIGIDKDFLDKQVKEKKQLQDEELVKECQLDEDLIRSSKVAILLEKQQQEERKRVNQEIESFRQLYQRREDRREFDLSDPDALKKSVPPRHGDDDSHLSLAAAQKFEGEDHNAQARMKVQREQTRWWFQKQKEEREHQEKEREDTEKAFQEATIARDKRAATLGEMERECRRRLTEVNARFNLALAEEQEHRRRCEALRDEEDKKAEIYNHVTGDFLTEAHEQAESIHGPGKPLASRYKGMTPEELKAFRIQQAQQIEEIQKIKQEEKRVNEEWDRLMRAHAQTAQQYESEVGRKRTEAKKKLAEENLQLAQQQKSRQEYLNRVVYKNEASDDFFEQFNRGTR